MQAYRQIDQGFKGHITATDVSVTLFYFFSLTLKLFSDQLIILCLDWQVPVKKQRLSIAQLGTAYFREV